MADSDINGLTAETAPAAADELVLQESGGGATKKITFANLFKLAGEKIYLDVDGDSYIWSPSDDVIAVIGQFLAGTSTPNASGAKLQTVDGLTFPATQSALADVNTLDDYEEGTFDVTLSAGGGGTITIDTTQDSLQYTKIGRVVYISGRINVSSVSTPSGALSVNGLPFTSASDPELTDYGFVTLWGNAFDAGSAMGALQGQITAADTAIGVTEFDGDGAANMANHVVASTKIGISGFYITES